MKEIALCGLFAIAIALSGCSSTGPVDSSGRDIANSYEAFKNGEVRFTCRTSCAGSFGWNSANMKKLYASSNWLLLANQVMKVGFESDLSYFYLAKAADGLGHYEAAAKYYRAAAAPGVHKCAGVMNNCEGHVFPEDLRAGIDSLPIASSLKDLVEKKAPPPTVAKINNPIDNTPAVEPVTTAITASNPALADLSPAQTKAVINGNGYPEITIKNQDRQTLIDAIKTDLIGNGWFISEESTSSFLAYKDMDSARKAGMEFAAKVVGLRKANSYKDGIYFLFASSQQGTKIVARPISIKSYDGDEKRNDQTNKRFVREVYGYLNTLSDKH